MLDGNSQRVFKSKTANYQPFRVIKSKITNSGEILEYFLPSKYLYFLVLLCNTQC